MRPEEETLREILQYRPELRAETVMNWAEGMSGCTLQTPHQTLAELLYRARHKMPMPWEGADSPD